MAKAFANIFYYRIRKSFLNYNFGAHIMKPFQTLIYKSKEIMNLAQKKRLYVLYML